MAEKKIARWKLVTGYVSFALFSLFSGVLLTFPYDALKDRAVLEADAAGYDLKLGSLGPGWFAVKAKKLELSKKAVGDQPVEALQVDAVSVGPTFFPPGLGVSAKALDGTVDVRLSGFSAARVRLDVEDVDLSKGNLKGFTGIDFAGTVEAHVDLTIPRASVGGAPPEPDLGQATGTLSLDTRGLSINGGTASLVIPQFGPEPTPLDLPKIVLGEVSGKIKVEKGAGTVEELKQQSADLQANATGTVKLAKRLEYSEPNVEVRFKPDPEFQKRLGLIGSAFSMIGPDPKDPTWRMGRLTGFLGRPNFR